MKGTTKINLYFGIMFVMCFVGVILSGDIFIPPREAEAYIDGMRITAQVNDKQIFTEAEEFLSKLGDDILCRADGDKLIIKYCGDTFALGNKDGVFEENSKFYIPMRKTAERLGCSVRWDSQRNCADISVVPKKNTMDGTVVTDDYRYYKYNGTFNGFDIFGNGAEYICTEKIGMTDEKCIKYADIVNSFADAVPEAQTYVVAVPTSSEFYSASEYKSNYTERFRYVYSMLSNNVRAVNTIKPLSEHAGEDIYFNTDHHWTQLGAYYAYREFLNFGYDEIKDPESFKKETIDYFQGSFVGYTEGTKGYDYMIDSYDKLDMYYPSVEYTGESYRDAELSEYIQSMEVINPRFGNYDVFMDGDYPIEIYKTNAPSDKKICIVKDSFGNAFAVWALNNYKEVYVVDYRRFNNYAGDSESYRSFKISDFYNKVKFDDLVIVSYPVSVESGAEITALGRMVN